MIDTSYPQIGDAKYDELLQRLSLLPFREIVNELRRLDWHSTGIQKVLRDLLRWVNIVDPQPATDSISATLAACSAPVPEIIRVHPTGAGDHGSIDITTGNGLTRYAVQQVLGDHGSDYYAVQQMLGRSLRDVTVGELAKLGLKPSQPDPRKTPATPEEYARSLGMKSEPVKFDCAWFDRYLLECGHRSPYKNSCVICAGDVITASQKPSHPEPPPTGNGTSTLHPRPFFWDSNERFGFVNVPDGYVTEPERMTLAQLLECVPNALNAHESHHPLESGQYPRFGFCREHTGPRTLREYLEAP